MNPKVSIFMPVYNEEDILEQNVKTVSQFVKKLPFECEIIIVDDASTDNSVNIEDEISKKYGMRFIRYEKGPTRRENLAQSFKKAKGSIVIMMDFDLATDLNQLPELVKGIDDGFDIVTGNRYHPLSTIDRKFDRLMVSKVMNGLVRLLFRTGLDDNFCGFKAFKKSVIVKLVSEMGFDSSKQRGVCWDPEMLARAKVRGLKIKDIPVSWTERKKSAMHFARLSEIQSLLYLFKLKKRL